MRLFKLLLFVGILALIAAPAAVAQQAAAPAAPAGKAISIEGKVDRVDAAKKEVDVAGKMLKVEASTKILNPAGQPVALSDVKEGDQVKASYVKKEGKDVAQEIHIRSEAGAGGVAAPGAPAAPETK